MYRFIFRHFLRHCPPERVHVDMLSLMQGISFFPPLVSAIRFLFAKEIGKKTGSWVQLRPRAPEEDTDLPRHDDCFLQGQNSRFFHHLPGRFGLAAGLDKDGKGIPVLSALGFSFIEVGTVTPRPQPGNDKPRLWRLVKERALRNKMGFNNEGVDALARRLRRLRSKYSGRSIVVGANIGKNKITPLDKASEDYRYCARIISPWVDYLVINVSSPNTPGLRTLQNSRHLEPIVSAVQEASHQSTHRDVPLFIKIAPDMERSDLEEIAKLVRSYRLSGVIATNTTVHHPYGEGGISGRPLLHRSIDVVRYLRQLLGDNPIIIGCGGVENLHQAKLMREAGADLVQAYTAFIYQGPSWPGKMNRNLA